MQVPFGDADEHRPVREASDNNLLPEIHEKREEKGERAMASLLGWWSRGEEDYGVDFWSSPERAGWLMKQGEHIKTWRRRWFVLKRGKLFWFKESRVTRASRPRGVIPVNTCLTVKGAEDALNKPFAFEISTRTDVMYFIADSEKEKEDWINSIGRSIVQHSRSVTDSEIVDYDSKRSVDA